ncbi:MAG: Spy/CpxP family protein refolding chaperone [Caldisericia bacterium]|nr:Spy/CpxP family protein refolding chaperone [Caldisericia bacterium]
MKEKILIIFLIILLSGLLVFSGVYATNLFKNPKRDLPTLYFKKLNLTQEQKEKIAKILKDLREKSQEILYKIKETNNKEKELISKENYNENELNLIVESQIKNVIDIFNLNKDGYLEILSILKNEQRKIFLTFNEFIRTEKNILKLNFIDKKIDDISKKIKIVHYFELKFLSKKLNLTDEQFKKLKELFEKQKEKEKDLFVKIRENNKKQREILKSDNLNKEALSNLINESILLEREFLTLRKNLYFEFLKILNPEQRKNSPTSIFFFKLI